MELVGDGIRRDADIPDTNVGFSVRGLEIHHEAHVGVSEAKCPGFGSPATRYLQRKCMLRAGILQLHPCGLSLGEGYSREEKGYSHVNERCGLKRCYPTPHTNLRFGDSLWPLRWGERIGRNFTPLPRT